MEEEQPEAADDRQHITPVIEDCQKVIYTLP